MNLSENNFKKDIGNIWQDVLDKSVFPDLLPTRDVIRNHMPSFKIIKNDFEASLFHLEKAFKGGTFKKFPGIKIAFSRHGKTDANKIKHASGQSEQHLTKARDFDLLKILKLRKNEEKIGTEQARELGCYTRDHEIKFDFLLGTRLIRTDETLDIAVKAYPELGKVNRGNSAVFSERSLGIAEELPKDLFKRVSRDFVLPGPPEGVNFTEVYKLVIIGLTEIIQFSENYFREFGRLPTIGLVAHNGPLRMLKTILEDIDDLDESLSLGSENCMEWGSYL